MILFVCMCVCLQQIFVNLVPSGPPSNVEVSEGPRFISVSWTPPKHSHQNGEIIGYTVSRIEQLMVVITFALI